MKNKQQCRHEHLQEIYEGREHFNSLDGYWDDIEYQGVVCLDCGQFFDPGQEPETMKGEIRCGLL